MDIYSFDWTAMDTIFRGMTRAELDLAYNNVKFEHDFAGIMTRYENSGKQVYESFRADRDIHYGPGARQRFDWVWSEADEAPTFVFVHGGYWQNYTKEELAFVALGPLKHGFNVALVEYTLAPDASMTQIANEVRDLLDFLDASTNDIGFGGRPVCLAGHSAGGHLAALNRSHPSVDLTVVISGIFDLEPISLSWLNDKLKLTAKETADFSPMRLLAKGSPMIVAVGDAELPELIRQSASYARAASGYGETAIYLPLEGLTHFTILDELGTPNSVVLNAIEAVLPTRVVGRSMKA